MMDYRGLSQGEYGRKLRLVVVGAEGLHAHAQDIGDGMATIGWGYTLNRNNNVRIWRESGIDLTHDQWRTLAAVDAAPTNAERTRIGVTFTRVLDATDSDSLLRASLADYAGPAEDLNMPLSDERVAMVSLAYNRGVGNLSGSAQGNIPEHPVLKAVRDGDRAEAWFQMRYNCWGSDKLDEQYPDADSKEAGLRKRRFAEAEVFGLYDDPGNVTPEQARGVYRAFQLHRSEVDRVEREFGVTVEGEAARRNRVAQANRDYPELVNEYGRVSTIADALAPARTALLQDLRRQHPEIADRLTDANFNAGRIYLDPGRDLQDAATVDRNHLGNNRTQNALRREQRNATVEDVDQDHVIILDSRRTQGNAEIASDDLLIGEGGNDTLRSHGGNDILIGGQGRDRMEGGEGRDAYVVDAGDTVMDSDGVGEVRWGGRPLTGGARAESDPANSYHSEDGRFLYALENNRLSVTDTLASDQERPEAVVIENFQSGQLGVALRGPTGDGERPRVDRQHPGGQERGRTMEADRGPDNAVPLVPAGTPDFDDRQSRREPERGSFSDPYVDSVYAALLAGDSKELDRIAGEFSRSREGHRFTQMGEQMLAQQKSQEQPPLQEQGRGLG